MGILARSFGTHDGVFHADEVTACALFRLFDLIDIDKVFRSRDRSVLSACEYVCDVGGVYAPEQKRFDHHQVEYRGILSSAGMVLEYLRSVGKLADSEAEFLNFSLIRGVDAHDNGKDPQLPGYCLFSHVISNFAPVAHEAAAEEYHQAFLHAVTFTVGHLQRLLDRLRYIQSCREEVHKVMKTCDDCLIFDKSIPWMDSFFELGGSHHPAKFVIMPSGDHWKLRGIPPTGNNRMSVRIPLPASWAGLMEEKLQKVSSINGAVFCHKGRFISVWKTKEDALLAFQHALHEKGENNA
jgi:uncharacterized UPF0160 family protein